jgi:hypothetical protein
MKIYHCRVLKPFDRYDNPGALASLSENGFNRINGSRMRDSIELLCVEQPDGDVVDASGNVLLAATTRKGAPVDPFAVAAEAAAAAAADPDAAAKPAKKK